MLPSRDARLLAIHPDGRAAEMSLGALIDFIMEELLKALLEEGFISRADIDAFEQRQREVARLGTGRDNLKVVQ